MSTIIERKRRFSALLILSIGTLFTGGFSQQAYALACSATVADVDFGKPDLFSQEPTDALSTLTVTCTGVFSPNIVKMCPSISDGSGGSNGSARLLSGPGTAVLLYQLYEDASRTLGWGSDNHPELGTIPAIILSGTPNGVVTASRSIYARLFGNQSSVYAGSYDSAFTGYETVFGYTHYFAMPSNDCTGFVGASTVHPQFTVLAAPSASCTLITTDLAFPATGALTSAINGQTSLHVTCTHSTAYTIALNNGLTGTGPSARKMTSTAGAAVTYGLYHDAAHTQLWGAVSGQTATGIGSGTMQTFNVYGHVPVQNTPIPGAYSDRVIVTLTY